MTEDKEIKEKDLWIVLLKHRSGYIEAHALTEEKLTRAFEKYSNYIKTIKTTY